MVVKANRVDLFVGVERNFQTGRDQIARIRRFVLGWNDDRRNTFRFALLFAFAHQIFQHGHFIPSRNVFPLAFRTFRLSFHFRRWRRRRRKRILCWNDVERRMSHVDHAMEMTSRRSEKAGDVRLMAGRRERTGNHRRSANVEKRQWKAFYKGKSIVDSSFVRSFYSEWARSDVRAKPNGGDCCSCRRSDRALTAD